MAWTEDRRATEHPAPIARGAARTPSGWGQGSPALSIAGGIIACLLVPGVVIIAFLAWGDGNTLLGIAAAVGVIAIGALAVVAFVNAAVGLRRRR